VDRGIEVRVQQMQVFLGVKADEHTDSQSISYYVEWRTFNYERNHTHHHQIGGGNQGLQGLEKNTQKIDLDVELNRWPNIAHLFNITESNEYEEETIQFFTEGRINDREVEAEDVIFVSNELNARHDFYLNNRSSYNEAD